jgi:hypothetical protein
VTLTPDTSQGKNKGRTCPRPYEWVETSPAKTLKQESIRTIGQPMGAASLEPLAVPALRAAKSLIHPILSLFQIRLAGVVIRVNLRLLTVHQVEVNHRVGIVRFEFDGFVQSLESLINQRPILLGEPLAEFFRDYRQFIRMGGILGW